MQKIIAMVALVLSLLVINWSIYQKEQLLENGQRVLLKLVPVDPRSLMQGDYMALRFDMANKIQSTLKETGVTGSDNPYNKSYTGHINIELDQDDVGSFVNLVTDDVAKTEVVLQFRLRQGKIKFATNAYFFEEGSAKQLEGAQYGEFRVNHQGELLLIALLDKDLNKLG